MARTNVTDRRVGGTQLATAATSRPIPAAATAYLHAAAAMPLIKRPGRFV